MAMRSEKKTSATHESVPLEHSERLWREQVSQLVSAEELQSFSKPSLPDTVAAIGVLWLEVAILLAAANLLPRLPLAWSIPAGVLVVLLMGLRMNAFGVILHEGSHGLLAKSRTLNDRICNWATAFWTINSVEEYRPTHRLHHRYLGQERDPDRVFYLVPSRRGALTGLVLQDLFGVTAFRRATSRISGTSEASGAPASLLAKPQLLVGKIVTQLIVLGQFLLFQGIWRGILFYAVFWLTPIVCLYPMILRLKTITEHFDSSLRDANSVHWIARTSRAGWLQNHLVGARMEYHFEHHVLPTSPYRGLKRLHDRLDQTDLFVRYGEVLSHGYVLFLARSIVASFGARRTTNRAAR
ncbi:MAG TPA: fatty acid desaturase [Chloroflexota bacterium]|nr:fatty acid desaturase [Chloroflexota bacterium]